MTITVSVETYIRNAFDKFYEDAKFKGVFIDYGLRTLLDDMEEEIVELAQQEYTTEAEAIRDDAWDRGFEEGEQWGYENGFNAGYDRAIEDHEIDA